jgi:large subunit ribosomal protein L29
MKPNEVRELETEDLHVRIAELKEELFNLRFQLATGQLDNHSRIRQVRGDVARIRTILRERDYEALAAARTQAQAPAPAPEPAGAQEAVEE